jgi:hypothetical protein
MDLKTATLSKLKDQQELVDIFIDHFDTSVYGYIIDYSEEFLLIEQYDAECRPEGISVLFRDHITRLRWSGNEINNAARLITLLPRNPPKVYVDLSSMYHILQSIYSQFKYVSIHMQLLNPDIVMIGTIHEIDEENLVLLEYGTLSTNDRRYSMIALADITRVDAGGAYERNLLQIFNE